jgi:MFS transporter, SP family, general alpha glucoside:H+ symporter
MERPVEHKLETFRPATTQVPSKFDEASDTLLAKAENATRTEHLLTLWAGLKLYPKAVAWSMIMSTALIMDGYDFKLIGSLFAQPAFAKAFGKKQSNGLYQIPAPWQTGLNNGSNVGQMVGLLVAGVLLDRLGFRKTMMGALAVVPCLIFIQFFADGLSQLEAGQVLLGQIRLLWK